MNLQSCPSSQSLSAFHDGELDPHRRDEIAQHVAACAGCADELKTFTQFSEHIAERPDGPDLLPIERTRLHEAVDAAIRASKMSASNPAVARPDRNFRRVALLLSTLAASVLIVASAWLWELPGNHMTPLSERALVHAEPWEVAAVTLDPLYDNDASNPANDTRVAEAPIVQFMLNRVIGEGTAHETN